MLDYIREITVPYVECQREFFEDETPAVVIMDNFKGQITPAVNKLLEENDIHVCLLPPNTTDRLQPMDLSINKPAKIFLRQQFQEWYASQVLQQLRGRDADAAMDLQPIDLRMPMLKELGAKWLVDMYEYRASNPMMVVNGFIKSWISAALDGKDQQDSDPSSSEELSSDDDLASDLDEHNL